MWKSSLSAFQILTTNNRRTRAYAHTHTQHTNRLWARKVICHSKPFGVFRHFETQHSSVCAHTPPILPKLSLSLASRLSRRPIKPLANFMYFSHSLVFSSLSVLLLLTRILKLSSKSTRKGGIVIYYKRGIKMGRRGT